MWPTYIWPHTHKCLTYNAKMHFKLLLNFTVGTFFATATLENFYLNNQARFFIENIVTVFLYIFLYIKLKIKVPLPRDFPWKQWYFKTSKKLLSWLILTYLFLCLLLEHTELDSFAPGSKVTHIIKEMPDKIANLSYTSVTQRERLHFSFFSSVWGQKEASRHLKVSQSSFPLCSMSLFLFVKRKIF